MNRVNKFVWWWSCDVMPKKGENPATVDRPGFRNQKGRTVPTNLPYKPLNSDPIRHPLRAIVEIIDGELKVFPLADSDDDERRILDALRFAVEHWRQ